MDIYLLIEGQQEGPYSKGQVGQSLAAGFIQDNQLAWHEGLPDWTSLSNIFENREQPPATSPNIIRSSMPALPPLPQYPGHSTLGIQYPWYRSWLFVGVIIGIPWLLGPFIAVYLKPFMLLGLILVASGSIFYTTRGERKTLPSWTRWLAGGLVLVALPYYFSILLNKVYPTAPSIAITSVLQQDDQLGNQYHTQLGQVTGQGDNRLDEVAQLTSDLASRMRAIPIGDCPSDFQEAYTRHISCWSDLADVVAQHPHVQSGDEAFLEGMMRGLAGDPTGGAFEKLDEINSYLNNTKERHLAVKRSWEDVEAVAIKYGVQPSAYTTN